MWCRALGFEASGGEEIFIFACVGVMADRAGFVAYLLMSGNFLEIGLLVALEAELARGLEEQFRIVRLVGVVAGEAFAIAGRIVLEGGRGNIFLKVIVAVVTQVGHSFSQELLIV